MYICVCFALTEEDIQNLIKENGADLEALQDNSGVASSCGICLEQVEELINLNKK
jgi:bacterioferritin-associated ferredoxin